jgi:TonB-linked SusC/RagA family outer membrane protein
MSRRIRRSFAVLWTLAALPAGVLAQGGTQGTITGRVVDSTSHQPIAQAQVIVNGTTLGTLTNQQGTYRIPGVSPGPYTLRVLRLGYGSATQSVTVTAGAEATVDFALTQRAAALDVVTITATGEQQRKRESGVSVGTLNVDSLVQAPINTFSDVLSSRVPGVTVQMAGGTTGTGARVRIRGSNSVSLSNDPLLIVDGIRVDNAQSNTSGGNVGGQEPSRWNDIRPEDIASIEVIKGPAASALYGTAAANGVIQITTKRGRSGAGRFSSFFETGTIHNEMNIPANYAQAGTTPGGAAMASCSILFQGLGACTPTAGTPVTAYSPLATYSPFRDGHRDNYGLSVSGGGDATTYYLSGTYAREQGIYQVNRLRDVSARTNVHSQIRDNLDATISAGFLDSRLSLPQNDDNGGMLGSGLLGSAFDDPLMHGFFLGTPDQFGQIEVAQHIRRFTGSGSANYLPLHWLTFSGTAGVDFVDQLETLMIPPDVFRPGQIAVFPPTGERGVTPTEILNYTANGSAIAKYDIRPSLTGTTTLGVQYARQSTHGTYAFGQDLAPGTSSLNGVNSLFAVDETNLAVVTFGLLAQQQIAWRDRLFVTGGVRTDQNSAFGTNFKRVYYPAGSLSWVVSEEPFFPRNDIVTSFRLRTAYGESGQNPQFRQAITYFRPIPVALAGVDVPGVTVGGTGNGNLRPEKSKELEVGFDAGLLHDRANFELTYYHKTTTDALVAQNLPPSLGTTQTRYVNLGEVRNTGLELLLNARVVDTRPVRLDLTMTGATNHNKLVRLGDGVAPILLTLNSARHQAGLPLGSYVQPRIKSFADANGDGIIEAGEITLSDTAEYLGTPFPTREFSFTPAITLFKNIRLSGLLDYRGGMKLFNLTEYYRCALQICRAMQDRSTPLSAQAAAIAGAALGTFDGYIEDASFWKLREVSVTLDAPASWVRSARISGLSLTLAGRNLHTWTKYTGFDPELNAAGQANFGSADFNSQPPVRYYTARLNITW